MPETDIAPEVALYEAKEVKQFLQHDAVRKAFAATEDRIHREWERGQDPLTREMAWHKLQAFKELQKELRGTADRRPELVP